MIVVCQVEEISVVRRSASLWSQTRTGAVRTSQGQYLLLIHCLLQLYDAPMWTYKDFTHSFAMTFLAICCTAR